MTATCSPTIEERLEALLRDHPPAATDPVEFLRARFDAGLAWVHYPPDCGGSDAEPEMQRTVARRLREAGAPDPFPTNPIGIGMVGPTIAHHGTEAQRRHLRRLWTGEDLWCQLFSEPGAGSDLAGLATRAVRDRDEWVVDGQKVWTSMADRARYGLLLARTDVDAPKNKGITAFLVDLRTPGIEVRPLRQMTGDAEFNEVFFDGARLPADAVLGPEGQGWHVAFTTLMNERASIGDAFASSGGGPIDGAIAAYREHHAGDAVRRDRVVRTWIEAELVRFVSARAGQPGPAGSIVKLLGAEHAQRVFELTVDLLGPEGQLVPTSTEGSPWTRGPQVAFLRSRATTIEGGTSEVMRNILAERVLGLPREDLGPKDRPWKDIPRAVTDRPAGS
ncbi:MAG: acyl-CoA dehydrogenase family protein [Actinobacteria bacterium]|nr:acyl-CoA dehydrogenase family protein [Actinomycetota bacterium]